MEITILKSSDINDLQDTANIWLEKHEHEIEIVQMLQSVDSGKIIITFLWKLKEQF